MAFLSRWSGTDRLDLSDLADDGADYFVEIKKSLTSDETDRAEDARVSATNVSPAAGRKARAAAARRRSGESTPEDEETVKTLLSFNTGAYKRALLEAAIVDWNLSDEQGRLLPLRPAPAKAASIRRLPPVVRDRIFTAVEDTLAEAERTPEQEADFRDGVPPGGEDEEVGGSADPGHLGAGDVQGPAWADARAGDVDL